MPKREWIQLRYEMQMSADKSTAEIVIYGYIVTRKYGEEKNNPDVTAKDFDKMLKDAAAQGAKKLTLRINSGGGNVYQAMAMRTMLLDAPFDAINVRIDGICASAATLLACVPDAHVSIAEGAMFMIHQPSDAVWGNASEMERCAQKLRKMEGDVRGIYAKRCGKDDTELQSLMEDETWFTAQEAVDAGFADEVLTGEGKTVACVDAQMMETMRDMYTHMPEMAASVLTNEDSNGETAAPAVEPSVHNTTNKEDGHTMEIKDVTLEQLRTENPGLYESVMQAGAAQERERIQEIDDLTPAGEDYAQMAAEAKEKGISAMEFHKQIVKAHKQKGQTFMAHRAAETAAAANVPGGASEDENGDTEEAQMATFAKEMAAMAKDQRGEMLDSMY